MANESKNKLTRPLERNFSLTRFTVFKAALVTIMKLIFLLLLFSRLAVAEDDKEFPETVWSESEKALSCSPKTIIMGESVEVKPGGHHGKELAVYRHEDDTWLFMVVGFPPEEMNSLMTPEAFKVAKSFTITKDTTGFSWGSGGGNERIFSRPGKYTFYVSEILESEIGGYKCDILVKGH